MTVSDIKSHKDVKITITAPEVLISNGHPDPAADFALSDELIEQYAPQRPAEQLSRYLAAFLTSASCGMRDKGQERYVFSLVRLGGEVLCRRMGLPPRCMRIHEDVASFCVVLALGIHFIEHATARTFLMSRYEAAIQLNSPESADKAKRTTNSHFSDASNIFNPKRCSAYQAAGLPVPSEVTGFHKSARIDVPDPEPLFALTTAQFRSILNGLDKLGSTNPQALAMCLLLLYGGFRYAESKTVPRENMVQTDRRSVAQVRPNSKFRTKNGKSRRANTPPTVFYLIMALSKGQEYVVADTTKERENAAQDLDNFLRQCGVPCQRRHHWLRKVYATANFHREGAQKTAESLGHKTADTTMNCYLMRDMPKACVELFWKAKFAPRILRKIKKSRQMELDLAA